MVKKKIILFFLFIVNCLSLYPIQEKVIGDQGNRIALVIGNSKYKNIPLQNTINDAKDMATALEKLNFKVILKTDVNHIDMEKSIIKNLL